MPWKALLPYLASYAAAVVLFLPWLRTFVSQISNGALAPIGQPLNLDQLIGIVTEILHDIPLVDAEVESSRTVFLSDLHCLRLWLLISLIELLRSNERLAIVGGGALAGGWL
jgi:hypothetical protein